MKPLYAWFGAGKQTLSGLCSLAPSTLFEPPPFAGATVGNVSLLPKSNEMYSLWRKLRGFPLRARDRDETKILGGTSGKFKMRMFFCFLIQTWPVWSCVTHYCLDMFGGEWNLTWLLILTAGVIMWWFNWGNTNPSPWLVIISEYIMQIGDKIMGKNS